MAYRLTDFAENRLADWVRGIVLPVTGFWYYGLLSAADDATYIELAGTGYARQGRQATLANFAGTQGPGTTLASSGVSHITSNNPSIGFGTVGASGWGNANFIGLFDAQTGGNCWFYIPIATPVALTSGTTYTIPAGAVTFSVGATGGMTNYLANRLIDLCLRGQAFNTYPSTTYVSLYTVSPNNAGGGLEITGPTYARVPIASSTATWSSTQTVGGTGTSNGSAGRISNNIVFTFPAPPVGENWGTAVAMGIVDAATGGNILWWAPLLGGGQTIIGGNAAPSFNPNTLGITFD